MDAINQEIDKEKLINVLENFPTQIREASLIPVPKIKAFSSLTICGMGGSGLPGEIIKCITNIPVTSVKNYSLPQTATNALVLVVSYSGNTEEPLSAYDEAVQQKKEIISLSSGGKLQAKAAQHNTYHITVPVPKTQGPSGFQPRMAIGYQTIPLINMLAQHNPSINTNWNKVASFLESEKEGLKQQAKEIAISIGEKTPLIYASESFYVTAYKWKKNFNENTKIPAFSNYFPEFNHNEINAYQNAQSFTIIILQDKDDLPQIKKRMNAVKKIAEQNNITTQKIQSKGENKIERIFWTIYLGDWVSYYAALMNKTDPTPVHVIEEFKRML